MENEVKREIFYNGSRTLTHNCLFNFIVGSRGCGKTFWFKKWAIDDFLKNENQFIYVRRYEKEVKKSVKTFFDDIRCYYPDNELTVKGRNFYIDGKVAGYCIVLSTAKIEKSVSYPFVNKIGFDEFLIEKGFYKYLPDEVETFLNLYETVARPGSNHVDVTVFFLANAISFTNPYFLYFDLKPPTKKDKNGKLIYRKDEILIEMTDGNGFVDEKKKTRFGKMIDGTTYGDYSINNKFLLDDNTFVEKKSQSARYYFTLLFKEMEFGVWVDFNLGKFWVSNKIDPCYKLKYSVTMKDHRPNAVFLKSLPKNSHFKIFCEAYKQGCVYFENINIKNITYEVIKMSLSV